MKTFYLNRLVDVSGISGCGKVAEGVIFDSGKVVLNWIVGIESIVIYQTVEDLTKITCYNGNSEIV